MGASVHPILFYGFMEEHKGDWDEAVEKENGDDWERLSDLREKLGFGYRQIQNTGYLQTRYLPIAYYGDDHQIITPDTLAVQPEWDARLYEYAKAIGIELGSQKPAWHIIAYWG